MLRQKLVINLYFCIGYILTLVLSKGYAWTPIHVMGNLIVWTLLAWLYLKCSQSINVLDAIFTMAFGWLGMAIGLDIARQVIMPSGEGYTWYQYFMEQQPWSTLTYAAIFVTPFIGSYLYKKLKSTTPANKKIVIIGGGIGGLTAGIYAAKAGFDTEIYEQHTIVGGECTGWDRKGYHIDNCIHWLMGSQPGSNLYEVWKTVGAVGDGITIKRADRMYTSELNGRQLTLWQDIDRTEKEMIALSPEDESEIRKLMTYCRMAQNVSIPSEIPQELMDVSDLYKLVKGTGNAMKIFKAYKGMNIQDLMNQFKHPLIRCAISDFVPADSQANGFPMAYGNFVSGDGGIPEEGSRAMALRMQKKFESYGGKVYTGKGVSQIQIEGKKATGILLADGSWIECDYIIPTCDAAVTFGKLLPETYMEPLMKKMYANRKAYPVYSTFQVAFALDSEKDLFPAAMILEEPELVFTEGMGTRLNIKSYSYEPSFAPAGKQILQTLQGGSENVFEFWSDLYKDKEAYQEKKMEIATLTLKQVEKRFPELAGKLSVLDAWTPMTYVRYCSAYKGFYQSFMISKDSGRMPYPSAYIKGLDNVILGGQWINLPGGLPGTVIASKFAVQRILNKEGKKLKQ